MKIAKIKAQTKRQQMIEMVEGDGHSIDWNPKGFSIEASSGYVFNCTDVHELVYSSRGGGRSNKLYNQAIEDMEEGLSFCREAHCSWCGGAWDSDTMTDD
jgi:hypothetical protein